MKRQKDFDWYRFFTISMVVIGVGFFLFSLILPRYVWRDEHGGIEHNQQVAEEMRPSPLNSTLLNHPANPPQDEQDRDKQADEITATFELLNEENAAASGISSEEIPRGDTSNPSHVDFSEKNIDPAEVEAAIAAVNESAENYRRILIRRRDLALGLDRLYPETASEDFFENENREYLQSQAEIPALLNNYLRLTEDFDAFNSGGWINQAFSGMANISASSAIRRISIRFTDEMIDEYYRGKRD